MSLRLIVPVNVLTRGKSRLGAVLTASERYSLNREFLASILGIAALYPGLSRTLVVSACDEALSLSQTRGAQTLREVSASGLNPALDQARLRALGDGASELLVVASDLPLVRAEDLAEMVDIGRAVGRPVLATDRAGRGTNALYVPQSWPIVFQFGPDSCSLHQQQAECLGIGAIVLRRPRLAFDVDTQEDYAELMAHLANTTATVSRN
jgi:2-phospho-L-lactate/phosphoenolpyruvate guanylyltransferase